MEGIFEKGQGQLKVLIRLVPMTLTGISFPKSSICGSFPCNVSGRAAGFEIHGKTVSRVNFTNLQRAPSYSMEENISPKSSH
jgi:hypothetical protein